MYVCMPACVFVWKSAVSLEEVSILFLETESLSGTWRLAVFRPVSLRDPPVFVSSGIWLHAYGSMPGFWHGGWVSNSSPHAV